MLSIQKCDEILNKNGIRYTKEEIKEIRTLLSRLAEITLNSNRDETLKGKNCGNL